MICGAKHHAMAYRVNEPHGPMDPVTDTFPVTLSCEKPEEHDPPHSCHLPREAGDDAGKVFEWP